MTDPKTQPLPLLHLLGLLTLVLVLGAAMILLVRKTLMSQPTLDGVVATEPATLAASAVTLSDAVARMLSANPDLSVDSITFHTHESGLPAIPAHDVFDRTGGGLIWTQADRAWMDNQTPGRWIVTFDGAVEQIGSPRRDLIAFLPGIRRDLCEQIERRSTTASTDAGVARLSASLPLNHRDAAAPRPAAPSFVIGVENTAPSMAGRPYGCVIDPKRGAVYYHVLYVQ